MDAVDNSRRDRALTPFLLLILSANRLKINARLLNCFALSGIKRQL
jgi:hypothetical protein